MKPVVDEDTKEALKKHLNECGVKVTAGCIAASDLELAQKVTSEWLNYPKGWTKETAKKFWNSITKDRVHKRKACMKAMEGKIDNPGAFCNSLYQMFED